MNRAVVQNENEETRTPVRVATTVERESQDGQAETSSAALPSTPHGPALSKKELVKLVKDSTEGTYGSMMLYVFFKKHQTGLRSILFDKKDLIDAAVCLGLAVPTTLGDVTYSYRNRKPVPEAISRTAPEGSEWRVGVVGRSEYAFQLSRVTRVAADPDIQLQKVRDYTPPSLLSLVPTDSGKIDLILRSNRYLSDFLKLDLDHVHSQLRTTLKGCGQIELSALYAASEGEQVRTVVPVHIQTDGGFVNAGKVSRNLNYAAIQFADAMCRAVVVQKLSENTLALFEVTMNADNLEIIREQHLELLS